MGLRLPVAATGSIEGRHTHLEAAGPASRWEMRPGMHVFCSFSGTAFEEWAPVAEARSLS